MIILMISITIVLLLQMHDYNSTVIKHSSNNSNSGT